MPHINGKHIWRSFWNSLRFLISRVLVLYVLIIGISLYVFNVQNILDSQRTEQLNEIMPSFGYLNAYEEKQGAFDKEKADAYIRYYEKVNEFLPNQADVYSALGFCYYYAGKKDKAIAFFKKAIEVNPHVFWFDYNLGVIYYKQAQYAKSAQYLKSAIEKKPELALAFAGYSRVYRRIAHRVANYKERLEHGITQGYDDAFALLTLSYYRQQDYAQAYAIAGYAYQISEERKDFFLYYAGMASFKMREFTKAAYFFKELLKIDADNRDALFHLALSLRELGANPLADLTMRKALMMGNVDQKPLFTETDIGLKIF